LPLFPELYSLEPCSKIQIAKNFVDKLEENKIKIETYLTLLKLEKSPIEKIKKETKIERTHIYKVLERLQDKNFVTSVIENKTKQFILIDPKKLLQDIKRIENEFTKFFN